MAIAEIQWRPGAETLRGFGFGAAALFAAAGTWVFFVHGLPGLTFPAPAARVLGLGIWVVGAGMLLPAMLAPRILWPMYVGAAVATFPIRLTVWIVALLLVYAVVLTPAALLFRLIGRDALHRRFEPESETYWRPLDPPAPPEKYSRQS